VAVYGTLRRGQRNHVLLAGAEFVGTGFVRGALYYVPRTPYRPYAYPAFLPSEIGRVAVEIYRVEDDRVLAVLDQLERYDADSEASSQYLRRIVEVLEGPVASAHAYVYAGAPEELGERITDGDWVAYTARALPSSAP
jgi:gamma-glutamylcyclotransferase (GGCT)/AIG2-like uncharacterized protein YtfP